MTFVTETLLLTVKVKEVLDNFCRIKEIKLKEDVQPLNQQTVSNISKVKEKWDFKNDPTYRVFYHVYQPDDYLCKKGHKGILQHWHYSNGTLKKKRNQNAPSCKIRCNLGQNCGRNSIRNKNNARNYAGKYCPWGPWYLKGTIWENGPFFVEGTISRMSTHLIQYNPFHFV